MKNVFGNNILIGRASTHSFNGTIDEVRFYNKTLTPSQISKLYNDTKISFDIKNYAIEVNGSSDAIVLFDELYLNYTTPKLTMFIGNDTYADATTLTSSYQDIYNINANQTMPLKMWFDIVYSALGAEIDLSKLLYNSVLDRR